MQTIAAMRDNLEELSQIDLDDVIGGCENGGACGGGCQEVQQHHRVGRRHMAQRHYSLPSINVAGNFSFTGGSQNPNGGRQPDPGGNFV
jgi:hypothetical protein